VSPAQGQSLSAGIERVLPADVLLHPVSEGWERGEGPVKQVLLCFVLSESLRHLAWKPLHAELVGQITTRKLPQFLRTSGSDDVVNFCSFFDDVNLTKIEINYENKLNLYPVFRNCTSVTLICQL
jgi:hypothetical protein